MNRLFKLSEEYWNTLCIPSTGKRVCYRAAWKRVDSDKWEPTTSNEVRLTEESVFLRLTKARTYGYATEYAYFLVGEDVVEISLLSLTELTND